MLVFGLEIDALDSDWSGRGLKGRLSSDVFMKLTRLRVLLSPLFLLVLLKETSSNFIYCVCVTCGFDYDGSSRRLERNALEGPLPSLPSSLEEL